uniref:A-type allatostatin n=1 Tax=Megabalanus volcano TaxID=266495 RepID=A0A2D2CNM2_MEGVO|nr:A-type allatostatin [Megabalanus volcano]
MASRRLTLATLVALVACVTSHSSSAKQLSRGEGELSVDLDNYDDTYDLDTENEGVEKRDRTYGFGLGKRNQDRQYRAYGFGLGKRDRSYRSYGFGLGKRDRTYGFGLGKRQPSYSFGLGKRAPSQYAFGLGKRSAYDDVPEKRQTYGFGLGKRSWGWFDGPMRDVLKRPSYGFGLGKRSAPAGGDAHPLEDPYAALILLSAAEKMADEEAKSPAGRHRVRSTLNKPQTKPGDAEELDSSSSDKTPMAVRYQL